MTADAVRDALRDRARHDDPACICAAADLEAWERAEGLGSAVAAEATARKDAERRVPGLPARRTYKVLGWMVLGAFAVDSALGWLPPSDMVDGLDASIRYGTAVPGVALAGWSLLSEVRGWEGSDAATWFAKARAVRYEKRLAARRRVLAGTLVALGPRRLTIYRDGLVATVFTPDEVVDLSVDVGPRHMVLRLTTRDGVALLDWLPRDLAFASEVGRFAGAIGEAVPAG